MQQFKNPLEQSKSLLEAQKHFDDIKTPLDDFKEFEHAQYTGFDPLNSRKHYGIIDDRVAYPNIIESYKKSKGKFANRSDDPEIQNYFNERLKYRDGLYDRVRKIPKDKFDDFARGYGSYSDPFDWEEENYIPPKDAEEFLNYFDSSINDRENLEDYLKENNY